MNPLKHLTTFQKQVGSIMITLLLYKWLLGWQYAITLVGGILWHEYSHILAAKKMGMKTGPVYLLPFVGGVAFVGGPYKTYGQQAFVALAGPAGGAIQAFLLYLAYLIVGVPFLAHAALIIGFINLFNLLPAAILDGGQLLNTITYSINKRVGFIIQVITTGIAIAALGFIAPAIAVFVAWLGYRSLYQEYHTQKAERLLQAALDQDFPEMSDFSAQIVSSGPQAMTRVQMFQTFGSWMIVALALSLLLMTLKHLGTTL